MTFTRAIVQPPSNSLASGLTRSGLGPPSVALARTQHARYCEALVACGLELVRLPADERFPDGTFVEDAAIVTPRGAILTRPGAASRRGEVEAMRGALSRLCPLLGTIEPPGTVDGGDICQAGDHVLIGLTDRTNAPGAAQLSSLLSAAGYRATNVDLTGHPELLHLKTGLAALDDKRLVAVAALASRPELADFSIVPVAGDESYAANCVAINGRVLLPAGFPRLAAAVAKQGFEVVAVEMSEFQKMDGGISCLSIRL